ncbi:MAG: sigma-54 dependent transcriptional regulator [Planctomycetota bacterium]
MSDEKAHILVIDDEPAHAEAMAEGLERSGYAMATATGGTEALERLEKEDFDVVVTDLVLKEGDGMAVLREAKKRDPAIEVILVTAHGTVETAVRAMQEGAATYLTKPINLDELRTVVAKVIEKQSLVRTNEELRRELDRRYDFPGIIGNTPAMQRSFDIIHQVAGTNASILITGESGTGKELIARAIHLHSKRKNFPFVPLNCAALSEGVLESELFGHVKGSFTGAALDRKGRFEHANRGTLFLDEVGDMPLATQVKFLRVLEDGEVMKVGSNTAVTVDIRLIAATNQDLEAAIRAGKFREDLYFRLKVVTIPMSPLRERRGDIPFLVDHFVREFAKAHEKIIEGVSPAVRKLFNEYPWPGNVRELKNTVESMVLLTKDAILDKDDIPNEILSRPPSKEESLGALAGISLAEAEKHLIRSTLALVNGKRAEAAKMLGIGERTLYRKIKEYDVKE